MLRFKMFLEDLDEVSNCIFTKLIELFKVSLTEKVKSLDLPERISGDATLNIKSFDFNKFYRVRVTPENIIHKILQHLVGGTPISAIDRRDFYNFLKIIIIVKQGINSSTPISFRTTSKFNTSPSMEAISKLIDSINSDIANKIANVFISCRPKTDEVDWRPTETTPEDYYAL